MKAKYIPNVITVIRLILVIPFLMYLLNEQYEKSFYIFLVAGLSDGIDGFLARHFNWTSYLGALIDPIADKLLMMGSFLALTWLGILPLWLCGIVVLRDIVILSGVGGVYWALGHVEFEPSLISKANTGLQVILIAMILFSVSFKSLPSLVILTLMGAVSLTSVLSLLGYICVGVKQVFYPHKTV